MLHVLELDFQIIPGDLQSQILHLLMCVLLYFAASITA